MLVAGLGNEHRRLGVGRRECPRTTVADRVGRHRLEPGKVFGHGSGNHEALAVIVGLGNQARADLGEGRFPSSSHACARSGITGSPTVSQHTARASGSREFERLVAHGV